ncbi:SDR family NAD(P)-dependent oxidoreductase [Roseisolibacter agri]|uniref:SDR family NAD(P)-dependent oxidoreductase n=1 Tax=Roseisolibacter agri TaxID=2014610 RepID=UPI0024E04490|nr:SDR family oxidoreductase [Roseisolibacter agri]
MVVLITGVGREGQVGESVARAFAAHGARLALVDRTAAQAERQAAALRAEGHEAHGFGCDLADVEQVDAMIAQVHAIVGDVDALVCAAGGFAPTGPLDETAVEDIERQLGINLKTAVLATRAALPMLRRTRGSIVYFGSAAVLPGATGGGMLAYAMAKSGVLALMRAVAEDERAHGVRANAVAPTSIRTAANVAAMGDRADYVSREEVAASVLWLCSDAARAVTGQVLRLG